MARAKNIQFVQPGETPPAPEPKKAPAPRKTTARRHRPPKPPLSEQLQVTPVGLDPDRLMLDRIDTSGGPLFSVMEACKAFGFQSVHWLRLQETSGYLTYNGKPIEVHRSGHNARQFTLSDMEIVAHGLVQNHRISGEHAVLILKTINLMAKMYGFLPADD
jgi:hypothetical protein